MFKGHCFIFLLPIVAFGVQVSFNEYFVTECRWDMLIGSCPVIYRALVGVVEVSGGYIPPKLECNIYLRYLGTGVRGMRALA